MIAPLFAKEAIMTSGTMTRTRVLSAAAPGHVRCAKFLERLMVLDLAEWLRDVVEAPSEISEAHASALAHALTQLADPVAVWSACDDVETALFRFECAEGRVLLHDATRLAHLRMVTERAACCLLVRELLNARAFDAFYLPFARSIPADSLEAHG